MIEDLSRVKHLEVQSGGGRMQDLPLAEAV